MNRHSDPDSHSKDGRIQKKGTGPNRDQEGVTGNDNRAKQLRIMRLLVSVFILVPVGIGAMAVLTAHYYVRSGRLGGTDISLSGSPAIVMGLSTVFLALAPLAVWCRTKRAGIVWVTACFAAAAAAFCLSVFLQHISTIL